MCESTSATSSATSKTARHLPKSIIAASSKVISRANSESDPECDGGIASNEFCDRVMKKIKIPRTKKDKDPCEMCIFKMEDYDKICESLSSTHLKLLCTTYGLKCTGTKAVMASRAKTHCIESYFSLRLQRVYREIGRAHV